MSDDPEVSEWGNPAGGIQSSYSEYIAIWGETQGIEISKYLKEKKEKSIPLVATSEEGRA